MIGDAMRDRHLASRSGHAHFNLFLQAGERLDRRSCHQAVRRRGDLHGSVVGRPSCNRIFRRFPDAISSTKLKLIFAALAELLREFLEEVLPADEAESNDPRPNIAGYDEFDFTVADAVALVPALVVNLLDFGFSLQAQRRSKQHNRDQARKSTHRFP